MWKNDVTQKHIKTTKNFKLPKSERYFSLHKFRAIKLTINKLRNLESINLNIKNPKIISPSTALAFFVLLPTLCNYLDRLHSLYYIEIVPNWANPSAVCGPNHCLIHWCDMLQPINSIWWALCAVEILDKALSANERKCFV